MPRLSLLGAIALVLVCGCVPVRDPRGLLEFSNLPDKYNGVWLSDPKATDQQVVIIHKQPFGQDFKNFITFWQGPSLKNSFQSVLLAGRKSLSDSDDFLYAALEIGRNDPIELKKGDSIHVYVFVHWKSENSMSVSVLNTADFISKLEDLGWKQFEGKGDEKCVVATEDYLDFIVKHKDALRKDLGEKEITLHRGSIKPVDDNK